MRILQVRFRNLNSLVGEWEIDFTHPAFVADGLFAITGPTGAGKSTVLDAICLALYGRTPRLGRVTRGGNEIMSRQTGECSAEVTFEAQAGHGPEGRAKPAGRFRCSWSQRRARRRPDGELQPPRHEIADATSGAVLETRLAEVAERVAKATGMDFDRFTRSMLLAQGGFAAFLQASPDERAPVLEQITGTEIYSRISVRVHERRVEERRKLDVLRAELAGMRFLGEEEEGHLRAYLRELTLREADLRERIAGKKAAVAWLDAIALLEEELCRLNEGERQLFVRREGFRPELEKLRRAEASLELVGEHAVLVSLREAWRRDGGRRGEYERALPALEEAMRLSEEARIRCGETQAACRKELDEAVPLLREVRGLDLRIRDKAGPIGTAERAVTEGESALAALRERDEAERHLLREQRTALDDVTSLLARSVSDEGLVTELQVLRERFDMLGDLDMRRRVAAERLEGASRELEEALRVRRGREEALTARRNEGEVARSALEEERRKLADILAGSDAAAWRTRLEEEKERKRLLDALLDVMHFLKEARRHAEELRLLEERLRARRDTLAGEARSEAERRTLLEEESARLEEQLSRLRRVADFERERHRLRNGEPCPLCGAREHPFAAGLLPAPDETAAALASLKEELRRTGNALADLRVAHAEASKDLERTETERCELTGRIVAEEARFREGWMSLAPKEGDAEEPREEEGLVCLAREAERDVHDALLVVRAAERAEEQCAALRESLEKTRESLGLAEREARDAVYREDTARRGTARTEEAAAETAARFDEARRKVLFDLAPYGIGDLSSDPEEWETLLRELAERRENRLSRREEKSGLEREIASLVSRIEQRAEQIGRAEDALRKQRQQCDELLRERDALVEERRTRFGDRDPDEEERRFDRALKEAEKEFDAARIRADGAVRALGETRERIAEIERATASREAELRALEVPFSLHLAEAGFADEAAYLAALLPEEERKELQRQARALEEERIALDARRRDRSEQLDRERLRDVTDRSGEDLARELDELERGMTALQQEIGGLGQRLRENETAREAARERRAVLEAQEGECARIDALHELIGSADGKKYRNFVQCLTFDILIGHANRRLRRMTDRYLLVRSEGQSLELDVIDAYQAGEIRSTRNLSGGESFLVSLALALGLSRMASRNVRIDSLFLDEGFGTLDEDALDTALQTLAELRGDGKLIGVISHVPALKERIAAQIRVVPLSGGRSGLRGPGCRGEQFAAAE